MKQCLNCSATFEITQKEAQFCLEEKIPEPKHCPDCRWQSRLAHSNHLHLFKRKCDFTGKMIVSNHHQNSPYRIYSLELRQRNDWDMTQHGRDFDFQRSFFEQLYDLSREVPRPALMKAHEHDENSDYTNYAGKNRDCYFLFDSDENRDCYYSYALNQCRSCLDCYRLRKGELCFECIDCLNCYDCQFVQDSENCAESFFLKSCIGCKNCILCTNLRNKQYHIRNVPVSKEEYERVRQELQNFSQRQKYAAEFENFKQTFPHRCLHGTQNEETFGEYLTHCKNCTQCFEGFELWDCQYVYRSFYPLKNCLDTQECGEGEKLYNCAVCGYNAFHLTCCNHCLEQDSDLEYCQYCSHCSYCFGCIGLQRKKYCILNKQYTKEEYETLVPKIIAHMIQAGEYGEFFPIRLSVFPYNETLAQEYFPLTKEECEKKGYWWRDEEKVEFPEATKKIPGAKLPQTIAEVPDDILNWAIECAQSKRLFKIQKAELDLYRKLVIPVPQEHFLVRHERRRKKRNPLKLWERHCAKCQKTIQSSYAPERPEIVYCEECYREAVL